MVHFLLGILIWGATYVSFGGITGTLTRYNKNWHCTCAVCGSLAVESGRVRGPEGGACGQRAPYREKKYAEKSCYEKKNAVKKRYLVAGLFIFALRKLVLMENGLVVIQKVIGGVPKAREEMEFNSSRSSGKRWKIMD